MAQKKEPTVDDMYTWAVGNDIPAPDAFAVTCWDLIDKPVRLRLAAAVWKRRVARGTTGFPAIDNPEA